MMWMDSSSSCWRTAGSAVKSASQVTYDVVSPSGITKIVARWFAIGNGGSGMWYESDISASSRATTVTTSSGEASGPSA